MISLKTSSYEETVKTGALLGAFLDKGDVVTLSGDLGAGKTAFTGGIAEGLGVKGYITSPTFTIVNEYNGRIPLFHFDVYRIADPEEMFEIGFDEYMEDRGAVVIEWADLISDIIPAGHIRVDIRKDLQGSDDSRTIEMSFRGKRYEGHEERMKEVLGL